MKKILIVFSLVIVSLMINNMAFSFVKTDVIVIVKNGGGPNGFDDVVETHYYDPECKCYWHKLYCKGVGYSACTWVTPPLVMRLVSYAEEQILKGTLNGTYEEFIEGKKHIVEWNATDIYNANITETVYKDDGNQH